MPYGHSLIAKYAMAARRHMHAYGTTLEQLAEVAVTARANAAANPEAMFRDPITVDDVLSGPMIADPFTKLHCCIRSDGGCAVLLAAEEYVPDTAKRPVWILGAGEHVSHSTMSEWEDFTVSPAAVSGRLAFERAGVRPADIDLAEIYDAFTYMTLVTLEDLGFCAKGEGGAFVEKGRTGLRGELPVNTDGGGLSACHPGMRGLFLLVEAVRQLRGEAGGRQVHRPGGGLPELAVASGTGGWFCSSGTVVLGRGERGRARAARTGGCPSITLAPPRALATDPVLRAEEVVRLTAHRRAVHPQAPLQEGARVGGGFFRRRVPHIRFGRPPRPVRTHAGPPPAAGIGLPSQFGCPAAQFDGPVRRRPRGPRATDGFGPLLPSALPGDTPHGPQLFIARAVGPGSACRGRRQPLHLRVHHLPRGQDGQRHLYRLPSHLRSSGSPDSRERMADARGSRAS